MEPRPEGRWRKRIMEGVVILFSVLAAFAIDAWWDGRQDNTKARAEVAALRSEFDAVDRGLTAAAAEVQRASTATHEIARLAGPRPPQIAVDSLARLFVQALTVSAVELPTGALGNVLSSGDLPLLNDLQLQTNLASWPAVANLLNVQFKELVNNRDHVILPTVNRLTGQSGMLLIAFRGVWTDDNPFPFNPSDLLRSQEFESVMAERWVSLQLAGIAVADARKRAQAIRTAIEDWR